MDNANTYSLKMQIRLGFLYLVFGLSAIASAIICIFYGNYAKSYSYIAMLPGIFLIFDLLLWMLEGKNRPKITLYVFLIMQWLRTVILPMIGTLSGYFSTVGSFATEKSAELALRLTIYETIAMFLVCILCLQMIKYRGISQTVQVRISGNQYIYTAFILVAAGLFLTTGLKTYQFFLIQLSSGKRLSLENTSENNVIEAIIGYGLSFIVILLLYYCAKKYIQTYKRIYVYLALGVSLLRLCLISSEGRLSILYLLGAFLIILPRLFPDHKKRLKSMIVLTGVAVIGFLTVYKVYYAFLYNSYTEAIKANSLNLEGISSQIDSYFFGLKTIARNIEFCKPSETSVFHLLTDMLKNTFGLHYFMRGHLSTVQQYNLYIYSGTATSGYLFSSLAYGYLYAGPFFAPVFSCVNLVIAFLSEKLLCRIKNLDVLYISSLIFVRIQYSVFSNFPQSWNIISRTLVISVLVIGGASLFEKHRRARR